MIKLKKRMNEETYKFDQKIIHNTPKSKFSNIPKSQIFELILQIHFLVAYL